MRELLLVSNSTQAGRSYLEHCDAAAQELFAGRDNLVFVPFALHNHEIYAAKACAAFAALGFRMTSLHAVSDPAAVMDRAGGVFVGGGNTFRLASHLYRLNLVPIIRRRVLVEGMPYMGTSAGANLACATICTTNDMPIVYPPTFAALGLVPFQINPHFIDRDPASTHMGESREDRIREYHEEQSLPVVGLREGAWLRVRGEQMRLLGETGGKLFEAGSAPVECHSGYDLSQLLQVRRVT